ncbi:MAG: hypothetical protein A2032_01575 [Chloroflexi bacterium RBG_19FT_COMBO_49_13]|nr:MAG: hypothetical protein A2032_01575 [Chloroflexi bacterium RBG_19FT_COMBO_49_13]
MPNKDPRLLIVGGSGFIGRNVVAKLAVSGQSITATYFHDTSFVSWASQWSNVLVTRFDGIRGPAQFSNFDVCLYLAGNANHYWASAHPQEDLSMNTLALLNSLSGFRGHLVYVSSGAVYYGLEGPVSPTIPLHPIFPYAISKYVCELYIEYLKNAGRLQGYTIIRLYYAYGPFEPSRRLIPTLIRKLILENADTFSLNGDGQTLLAPLFVDDVSNALCKSIFVPALNQPVDLCAEHPLTLQALVEQVSNALGRKIQINHRPTEEESIHFWSSNAEANRAFALDSSLPLAEGVRRYARWILSTNANN